MKKIKFKNVMGMLILINVIVLAVAWYNWKLALLIFLALLGNNLEQSER